MRGLFVLFIGICAAVAPSAHAQRRVLTLKDALSTARRLQPQVRVAHAQSDAARAKKSQALAPLLPQITGTASMQRTTANYVFRPGVVPQALTTQPPAPTFDTFNYYSFGVTVSQLLYDFGTTPGRYDAASANATAQLAAERAALVLASYNARRTFFNAVATKTLRGVSHEMETNRGRQLELIEGLVRAGSRPEIDVIQARSGASSAEVARINADNNYRLALAQLNQALGIDAEPDFDVADDRQEPLPYEDLGADALVALGLSHRPELMMYEKQLQGLRSQSGAARGTLGPQVSASSSFTPAGSQLDHIRWNWNAGVNLNWSMFQGGLSLGQMREAAANERVLEAQLDAWKQQLRLDIEQARLNVTSQRAALGSSAAAVLDARERLRLAEGRYETGIGSVVELGDAQLSLANALSQQVQTEFNLAAARALLMRAIGE